MNKELICNLYRHKCESCPCNKWEFNGANDELLLLEIERLRQMLEIASIDISKFINCKPCDYLHDLSTRDYYEDIKENE